MNVPQNTASGLLTGKVALVTGGSSGIGLAAGRALARAGAAVILASRDPQSGETAVQQINAEADIAGDAQFVRTDVSQSADVQRLVAFALDRHGRIDVLFNNAAILGAIGPLTELAEDAFDQVMAINVKGVFLCLKHVIPVMLRQQSGSIINTSSINGLRGSPGMAAYATSKHAIIGLTRTAAAEYGKYGVRVNAICPGPIHTPMIRDLERRNNPADPEADRRARQSRNPTGRYGAPEEIASVVVFLASEQATFVNGAVWPIDGGRTAI